MLPATPTKNAIVIGVAAAFGQEIILRLAEDGYNVSAVDKDTSSLTSSGKCINLINIERTDQPKLAALFAALKQIDLLMINVPLTLADTRFVDITDDQFAAAMHYFFFDVVAANQIAYPYLVNGARIVHVSSKGFLGAWGGAHTIAASAALVAYTRSLSLELTERDITVNTVAPDFVGSKWDQTNARTKVANAVAFFAAPNNGVSGETLLVDDGRSLRMTESRRRTPY